MLLTAFRALMPKDERFIDRLCDHARHVASGAAAFRDLLAGGDTDAHHAAICRFEEEADRANRAIVEAIHRSFIPPFDRSQILALTTALDDTIDLMKDAGRRIRLYGVAFTPEMRAMGTCALRATVEIREAMPYLSNIPRHASALRAMQDAVRAAEAEADALFERGLSALFTGAGSAGEKLTVEKLYELIEAVVDRCEDVADVIEGIVVDHV